MMLLFVFLKVLMFFCWQPANCEQSTNQQQNSTIIDIDWKFNHILILPVGCSWASNVIWRIRMNCPMGHFFVPTRLQASTNSSFYCSTQSGLFSNQFYAHQLQNEFAYLKQVRQMSSRVFGDGKLNRYDYPYFPIYNQASSYWKCVGTNSEPVTKGCSFLVRSGDYEGRPASHGFGSGEQPDFDLDRDISNIGTIATLVLPGPYCSTLDSYENVDRSGGIVYRAFFKSSNLTSNGTTFWEAQTERREFENQNGPTEELEPSIDANGDVISKIPEEYPDDGGNGENVFIPITGQNVRSADDGSRRLNLHQSENVHFVVRGESRNGKLKLEKCLVNLWPRDVGFAKVLWQRNRNDFMRSLLANVHVQFIQIIPSTVRYRNYSTFYDDMTASQHHKTYRNLFTLETEHFTPSSQQDYIQLALNFNAERRLSSGGGGGDARYEPVRIGAALYEFLVVGDEHALRLQSMWPYRYSSPYSQHLLLLLRNVTVDGCLMEEGENVLKTDELASMDYYYDDSTEKAELVKDDEIRPSVDPTASGRGRTQEMGEAADDNCSTWWCRWKMWFIIGGLISAMISLSIAALHFLSQGQPR